VTAKKIASSSQDFKLFFIFSRPTCQPQSVSGPLQSLADQDQKRPQANTDEYSTLSAEYSPPDNRDTFL
jgi:hypothetical protein